MIPAVMRKLIVSAAMLVFAGWVAVSTAASVRQAVDREIAELTAVR